MRMKLDIPNGNIQLSNKTMATNAVIIFVMETGVGRFL